MIFGFSYILYIKRINKLVTIKEVSELAKVSQATVSRVLNNHHSVKDKNKKKVLSAIKKLGYKPNTFAQALASNRSNSIGMLVTSLEGPFYGPLMHNAENTLRNNHVHLIITSGQESKKKEIASIHYLLSKQVDGLIIHSDNLTDNELIELTRNTVPLIIINRYIPELSQQCICIDNELGGYLATKHLIDAGHHKIACITGQLDKIESRDRLQGYRNALNEFGIAYDSNLVAEGRFDHGNNQQVVKRLFERENDISAVFCHNDNIALAVYDVCADVGLEVAQDMSIVGYDNDTFSEHIRPRLTTINFPTIEMGAVAADSILSLINDKTCLTNNKLIPELIIRDSVKQVR